MNQIFVGSKAGTIVPLRRNNIIDLYLKDLRKVPILTPEEERKLFIEYNNGNTKARDEIIYRNQRFVVTIAKTFAQDERVMDLIEEGNIGLMRAFEKYDVNSGNRFCSYAVYYIRRAILSYLNNECPMVQRSNNGKIGAKIPAIKEKFLMDNGRYPTESEIIDILKKEYKIKVKNKSDIYDVRTDSINQPMSSDSDSDSIEDGSIDYNDKTSSHNEYTDIEEKDYAKEIVNQLLNCLNKRERIAVTKFYGIGCSREYSIDEISEDMGLTRERVRQLIKKSETVMRGAAKQAYTI